MTFQLTIHGDKAGGRYNEKIKAIAQDVSEQLEAEGIAHVVAGFTHDGVHEDIRIPAPTEEPAQT